MQENNEPLITIGIPVFNVGRFISQTLKSVLCQTYSNFELIITDDGSSDNTIDILKTFQDKRIRLYADGENHGISYRLNQQIDLAKGKYFFRMDGDDLMFPNRVAKQVEYLETHPDVDVMGSAAVIIGDENELIGKRGVRPRVNNIDELFGAGRFTHPTVAGRIEWFKKWKYKTEMTGVEDVDLWLRSFNESNMVELVEPFMFYRDPLKFKLKTYLKRQQRLVECYKSHRGKTSMRTFFVRCLLKSYIAMTASVLLTFIGKDQKMIARRNQNLSEEELKHYKEVLKSIAEN